MPDRKRSRNSKPVSPAMQTRPRRLFAIPVVAALTVTIIGAVVYAVMPPQPTAGLPSAAAYVGSETCVNCHRAEGELWRTSQHKHAMAHATEKTVLGDFSGATFDNFGVRSRFFRRDGTFLVETDGPDGKLAAFEVKYTFGLDPLQQYLIEFSDGRLQALSIAWDSRPKDKGGQRWFHLYADEPIRHDDVLHWTKLNQNWNFMCAECHSTGVRRNYDANSDRFATTFAEISVGCEACHGQGSRHVAWAKSQISWWPVGKQEDRTKGLTVLLDERRRVSWSQSPQTGLPQRSPEPALLRKEVETCGLCHARRSGFSENWTPGRWLSDTHQISPLSRGLFHADGQMRDIEETYNYAAFKQSKMFAKGVTCSDCHDPHSAALRMPGDGVCLQCHASDKYETAAHSRHEAVKPALACASCHMPARNYMVVDRRRDHGFRTPRPDISVRLGVPNACNDCHTDKSSEWAALALERWRGATRKDVRPHVEAFHAAWTGQPEAANRLAALASDATAPAFARASALTELGSQRLPPDGNLVRSGLADPDPMVRIGAIDLLDGIAPAQKWSLVAPLLADPVRGVRLRAVSSLAGVADTQISARDRDNFERAAAEFVSAQQANADRPEARSSLGSFYAQRGRTDLAESEYKAALRLSPQFAPAAVNLADLYRYMRRENDGETVLRTAISASPRDAGLHHALGLSHTRLKRSDDALRELELAARLEPEHARYSYVYAIALHSAGRVADALTVLKDSLARHPGNRDILAALISVSRNAGDFEGALTYARQLARMTPADQGLAALIKDLEARTGSPRSE